MKFDEGLDERIYVDVEQVRMHEDVEKDLSEDNNNSIKYQLIN